MYRNIQFKIMNFCNGLVFFAPVATLLRTSKGVTLSQFFLLQALLSVMIFIMEIPTGVLADRIGYKKGILASQIILFAARSIFLFADSLSYFVAEAVLEAFSCCFMSGTAEAYLYEMCKARGEEELFVEESAKVQAWGTAGFIVSTIGYAVLYHFTSLNGLVAATEIATLVSIIAVICMPKAAKKAQQEQPKERGKLSGIPGILWKFMLFDAMIGLTGLVINFLYVQKLEWSGIPVEWMTPVILGYSALDLLVPKIISLLSKQEDAKVYRAFSLVSAFLLMGIFGVNNYLGVVFMMAAPFMLNIVGMIQYKYENRYIDEAGLEQNRAAMLSVLNMGVNLLEIVFLVLSAVISSARGNGMFLFAGIMMFLLAFLGSRLIKTVQRQ